MPSLTIIGVTLFALFVVPGVVALQAFRLVNASTTDKLSDRLVEASVFGTIIFLIVYSLAFDHFIRFYQRDFSGTDAIIVFGCLVVFPALLGGLAPKLLNWLAAQGWILQRAPTAWDHFFGSAKEGLFVQARLKDGTVVGGRFKQKSSYASASPRPGHIFITEEWTIGDDGGFVEPNEGVALLLRPSDYDYIRVSIDRTGVSDGGKD